MLLMVIIMCYNSNMETKKSEKKSKKKGYSARSRQTSHSIQPTQSLL